MEVNLKNLDFSLLPEFLVSTGAGPGPGLGGLAPRPRAAAGWSVPSTGNGAARDDRGIRRLLPIYRELLTALREQARTWWAAVARYAAPNILLAGLMAEGLEGFDRPAPGRSFRRQADSAFLVRSSGSAGAPTRSGRGPVRQVVAKDGAHSYERHRWPGSRGAARSLPTAARCGFGVRRFGPPGMIPLVGIPTHPGYRQPIETTNEFARIKF